MLQIVASAIVLGGLALVPFCVARRGARQRLPPPAAAEFSSAADDQCVSWQSSSLSSLSNLERHRTPTLPAQADECKIAVRAIGLNYADVFCCLGLYEAANKMLAEKGGALCPGLEFAGEVMEVGPEVRNLRKGDRVYGFSRFVRHLAALKLARRAPPSVRRAASMFIVDGGSTDSCSQGAYRTKIIAREPLLRKVPADWTYAEAASLLVQGLTAWHGLVELGGARKGSRVLVHSAAGGVGCAALTICDAIGADAVAVVGAAEKVEFLRARYPRCTPLVRARESQYAAQLAELGGEFDVVLESLGGRYLSAALDRVAPMGRMVHFGATHAYGGSRVDGLRKWLKLVPNYLMRPKVDPGELVPRNRALIGFNLIWLTEREDMLAIELDRMCSEGGMLARPPAVGRKFPFAELPQALDWLRSGRSVGKVVVTVESEDSL